MAGAIRARGQTRESLGDNDGALADYRAALAIVDGFGAPASPDRLQVLESIAALQCRRGAAGAGRAAAELAISALDPGDPQQATWLARFRERLDSCPSVPGAARR